MKSLNVWDVQKSFSFLKTMHGKRKKKTKEPHSSTEINTPSFKPGPRVASSGWYTKDMTPLHHSSVVAQNIFPNEWGVAVTSVMRRGWFDSDVYWTSATSWALDTPDKSKDCALNAHPKSLPKIIQLLSKNCTCR